MSPSETARATARLIAPGFASELRYPMRSRAARGTRDVIAMQTSKIAQACRPFVPRPPVAMTNIKANVLI